MKMFYSAASSGFFSPDVHATLPADALPVSARRHADLLAAQDKGARIVPGETGKPELVWPDILATPKAKLADLIRRIRREARRRIERVSPPWRQMNDLRLPTDEGEARFAAIDAIRIASSSIEADAAALPAADLKAFAVRDNPLWPEGSN